MYPGLLSSCTIDLFGEWPLSALEEVGKYFIEKVDKKFDLKEYTERDYAEKKARPVDVNLQGAKPPEPERLPVRLAHVFTVVHDAAN